MKDFEQIVGNDNVRRHDQTTSVWPTTTEEVSSVMKLCAERNLTVCAQGGRTKPWGNPVTTDVHLRTTRLTGVREHSWHDLTATIAAGTCWADSQRALSTHHQQIALDPLRAELASVGGVLATNDSGPLRMKYGSLRDLVLGMTIVLADGTIARTGGKVVKNVAGYDLPKLLTGSFGTLSIITEATFRLHPLPKLTSTFTIKSNDITPVAELMTALLKAGMLVERMQLRTEPRTFALDVQFAGERKVLLEHGERLSHLAGALVTETAGEHVFEARDSLFAVAAGTVLKITCLTTKLASITAGIANIDQIHGHSASCVADPVGIITARLEGPLESVREIIADLRERLVASGGAVVVLQSDQFLNSVDRWGPAPIAIEVMRAIKQEFDPQRLLNPGVFVGGI